MSNPNDFVIENGILKKYVGPGGQEPSGKLEGVFLGRGVVKLHRRGDIEMGTGRQ